MRVCANDAFRQKKSVKSRLGCGNKGLVRPRRNRTRNASGCPPVIGYYAALETEMHKNRGLCV